MKIKVLFKSVLFVLIILSLASCNGENDKKENKIKNKKQTNLTQKLPQTLKLTTPKEKIIKDKNLTLELKYKNDNLITKDITWITTPKDSIQQYNSNTIKPLKDGNINLQAKHNNQLSNKITLNIKWIVDGHELPPMPDEKINNSTLLGIDVNHNDVRDDVERWIYEEYKDKHPIHIDIAMQAARGYKKVLMMPERALAITEEVSSSIQCEWYYKYDAERYGDKILINDMLNRKYFRKKIYFNTKERYRVYLEEYDKRLSGHTFNLPSTQEEKKACHFDTSKYDK